MASGGKRGRSKGAAVAMGGGGGPSAAPSSSSSSSSSSDSTLFIFGHLEHVKDSDDGSLFAFHKVGEVLKNLPAALHLQHDESIYTEHVGTKVAPTRTNYVNWCEGQCAAGNFGPSDKALFRNASPIATSSAGRKEGGGITNPEALVSQLDQLKTTLVDPEFSDYNGVALVICFSVNGCGGPELVHEHMERIGLVDIEFSDDLASLSATHAASGREVTVGLGAHASIFDRNDMLEKQHSAFASSAASHGRTISAFEDVSFDKFFSMRQSGKRSKGGERSASGRTGRYGYDAHDAFADKNIKEGRSSEWWLAWAVKKNAKLRKDMSAAGALWMMASSSL